MSMSQHSQPKELVSPAMGESYELLHCIPKEGRTNKIAVRWHSAQRDPNSIWLYTCSYLLLGSRNEKHIDWHSWNRWEKTNSAGNSKRNDTLKQTRENKTAENDLYLFFLLFLFPPLKDYLAIYINELKESNMLLMFFPQMIMYSFLYWQTCCSWCFLISEKS